jgi:hypothetical protein
MAQIAAGKMAYYDPVSPLLAFKQCTGAGNFHVVRMAGDR